MRWVSYPHPHDPRYVVVDYLDAHGRVTGTRNLPRGGHPNTTVERKVGQKAA